MCGLYPGRVARAGADLAELYTDYLARERAAQPAAELAVALASAGYRLEAAVVSGVAGGRVDLPGCVWHGRRLWTGSHLPDAARAGDVWLDTCQLSPMVLVPRQDEPSDDVFAWIDTRPLHRWQFAAFLALAQLAERPVQLDPPLLVLDRARLLHGGPTDAATDLLPDEARLCANWLAKALCGLFAWQSARAFLPAPTMATLWGTPAREWTGAYDEGVQLAVSPETLDHDPEAELDGDIPSSATDRIVFGEWAHSRAITFRTCVYLQLGLLPAPGEDGAWYFPRRLADRASR